MKKSEKEKIMSMDSIAYYYGINGVEIKGIEYGLNDYVLYVDGTLSKPEGLESHRSKIYYTSDPYFRFNGYRIKLSDCIRFE